MSSASGVGVAPDGDPTNDADVPDDFEAVLENRRNAKQEFETLMRFDMNPLNPSHVPVPTAVKSSALPFLPIQVKAHPMRQPAEWVAPPSEPSESYTDGSESAQMIVWHQT